MFVFLLKGGIKVNWFGKIKSFFTREEDNQQESYNANSLLESILRGETLTKEKAMSIPAFSSSVDIISNSVAILPIKLYKKTIDKNGKENIEEVKDDIRIKLLNQDPKDTLDSFQLKKAITRDYLIDKGAYIFVEKNRNIFKSLRYVHPSYVSYIKNEDPIFKDGKYLINGKEYELYEFITILRNTANGIESSSLVEELSKSLETAVKTIMYELGIAKKGGGKKGFIKSEKPLSDEAMKSLRRAWNRFYDENADNVVILNKDMDFKESSNSASELQLNERKQTLASEIKDIFHISDNYDETIKYAVIPIISAIECALNKNFLLEKEKEVFYFAFDTKKITRGSLKERYEAYKLAIETGWLGINEIRKEEDYSSLEGLDIIKMNLANVFYDMKNQKIYTPNTGTIVDLNKNGEEVKE
jgi:phage portal protein, HK97 family